MSCIEARQSPTYLSGLLRTTVLAVLLGMGAANADVVPQTMNGAPLLPIPTYEEVGLPTFTMPTGTPSFTPGTPPGSGMPATGDGLGGVDASGGFVAAAWDQYAGTAVGSGQCVALVQAADAQVGLTRTWAEGTLVRDNTALRPGTAIATFGPDGTYTNSLDGSSHAAIYLGQNERGIQVLDQWAGQEAAYRTIPWVHPSGRASNTGNAFHVITRRA